VLDISDFLYALFDELRFRSEYTDLPYTTLETE
jgi:hypothetical protein